MAADQPRILGPEAIQKRFGKLHSKNDQRAKDLRELFAEAGCLAPNYSEVKILSSSQPNIICVLPGSTKQTIVVTAHFDNRGPGEGAIDNWSGASLLPSLFESLRGSPHRFTFKFIGFTDEERGLIGSRDFVGQLSKEEHADIVFDVNIDSVGLTGPIRVWSERASEVLLTSAAIVADKLHLPIGAASLGSRYDSDASAFAAWKIPVIDFHSLTPETLPLLHSKRDLPGVIDSESYYNQYQFLATYLNYLDENMEATLSHK